MSKMYVSDLRQLLEDIAQEATLSAAKSVLDTIAAKDMATEATLAAMKQEITTVKSDLATVKSALGDGTAKVQLNGSSIPPTQPVPVRETGYVTIDTIISAMSVAADGNTGNVDMGFSNEQKAWVLVSIDKQPWTVQTGSIDSSTPGFTTTLFPVRSNQATTHASSTPATSLYLGIATGATRAIDPPETLDKAYALVVPPKPGTLIRVTNHSAETATVTVRIIRVWGDRK